MHSAQGAGSGPPHRGSPASANDHSGSCGPSRPRAGSLPARDQNHHHGIRRLCPNMVRSRYMVSIVFLTFFVMSLLTNILGPIVPDIISGFNVSLAAAAFLPFSFFIAYGVMSIPAGFFVDRFREKPVMIAAFLAGAVGSLSFALFPRYSVAVWSLFIMGAGMATLQTAINPLLRVSGGEEHFAFNSAFAQLIFGSASFVSPRIYSYLVRNLHQSSSEGSVFMRFLVSITLTPLASASM